MNCENFEIYSAHLLLKNFTVELSRGAKIIGLVSDSIYRQAANGTGSIGGHFRHNLDFADSFLKGISRGEINYNLRERDERIENDRLYAIKRFALTICKIRNLPAETLRREIQIRSEIDESVCHRSSVARELEFLHSHTVHHHALIAEKLNNFGIKISNDFGFAPSTLRFLMKKQKAA